MAKNLQNRIIFITPVTNPIQKADSLRAPEIHVASLPDLVATKLLVIQQRAEKKDYLDIAEILRLMPLSQALYYAKQLYGKLFNPFASLKALTYFEDGDLLELPQDKKEFLLKIIQQEDITRYE